MSPHTLDDSTITATTPGTDAATLGWRSALRSRIGILIRVLCFWTVWFAASRALFLFWFRDLIPEGAAPLVARSFLFGARMDLSSAAYLTAIPWLILTCTVAAKRSVTQRVLGVWSAFVVVFIPLVTMTDIGTFGPWRRRLDASLWMYLGTPNEAYASASSIAVVPLFGMLALLFVVTWWSYRRVVRRPEGRLEALRGVQAVGAGVALLASGALLAIPIRGGVQWTPINESTVYFSRSEFVNMASLNPGWYLLATTVAQQHVPTRNPYLTLPGPEVEQIVDSLYPRQRATSASLLRTSRPNVILIIWESFTAKVVERLGGRPGVTPQFDRWSHQGIFFDSLFASGDRSAQGLVSILSGFPSVPNEAIMTRPTKAARLPQLGQFMQRAGYHTSYYYGGELAFANMKAYLINGGFERLIGLEAFGATDRNSKWGAHDHVVLSRMMGDLQREPRPFFSTVFTLSSHEPFEVPVAATFPGADESVKFLNAHHYSDASIAQFLDSASTQPWWDSTLVIIVADHGSPLPRPAQGVTETVPDRHHVPMLWLGGALRVRDTVVHRIASSVDLAPTLLAQLGISSEGFRWGQDLFSGARDGHAYFEYHDGFTFIDRAGWLVYDERAGRALEQSPGAGAQQQRLGAALLQATFADYLSR
ncbi:MAG: sulfatase-like hydrolase/transferase [Gemmatimonadaceae bacterium]|nr:sulfatase-like hydrolase/transferase [Gemmatimonadaceae bacterium]